MRCCRASRRSRANRSMPWCLRRRGPRGKRWTMVPIPTLPKQRAGSQGMARPPPLPPRLMLTAGIWTASGLTLCWHRGLSARSGRVARGSCHWTATCGYRSPQILCPLLKPPSSKGARDSPFAPAVSLTCSTSTWRRTKLHPTDCRLLAALTLSACRALPVTPSLSTAGSSSTPSSNCFARCPPPQPRHLCGRLTRKRPSVDTKWRECGTPHRWPSTAVGGVTATRIRARSESSDGSRYLQATQWCCRVMIVSLALRESSNTWAQKRSPGGSDVSSPASS
mmetsp:Transcript_7555/g.19482  ORF Transcript_7555/g.19482 Transcript_7555/m.19482 type:complete len:280 (-) Transcript_7555:146-985(-)